MNKKFYFPIQCVTNGPQKVETPLVQTVFWSLAASDVELIFVACFASTNLPEEM